MRSAGHLAGEEHFAKRKILTQSMTVMSILTRRLNVPLVNTHWRLKIISSEELHCPTEALAFAVMCYIFLNVLMLLRLNGGLHFWSFFGGLGYEVVLVVLLMYLPTSIFCLDKLLFFLYFSCIDCSSAFWIVLQCTRISLCHVKVSKQAVTY